MKVRDFFEVTGPAQTGLTAVAGLLPSCCLWINGGGGFLRAKCKNVGSPAGTGFFPRGRRKERRLATSLKYPFHCRRGGDAYMGDPEPLNLELLQQGNDDEIRRALTELDLLSLAEGTVHRVIGARYSADVRTVALESIENLFANAINRCRNVSDIKPNLIVIARRRAINFLNVAFRRREAQFGDEWQQALERPAAPEDGPFEVLGDILAEGLGMESFQLANVVALLLTEAEFSEIEKHLFIEHVIQGCTQLQFSERHGIPLQGIGGRKMRLLNKIRAFVAGRLPLGYRVFFNFSRRNRQPPLI